MVFIARKERKENAIDISWIVDEWHGEPKSFENADKAVEYLVKMLKDPILVQECIDDCSILILEEV